MNIETVLQKELKLPPEINDEVLAEIKTHLSQYKYSGKSIDNFGEIKEIIKQINENRKVSVKNLLALPSTWNIFRKLSALNLIGAFIFYILTYFLIPIPSLNISIFISFFILVPIINYIISRLHTKSLKQLNFCIIISSIPLLVISLIYLISNSLINGFSIVFTAPLILYTAYITFCLIMFSLEEK